MRGGSDVTDAADVTERTLLVDPSLLAEGDSIGGKREFE